MSSIQCTPCTQRHLGQAQHLCRIFFASVDRRPSYRRREFGIVSVCNQNTAGTASVTQRYHAAFMVTAKLAATACCTIFWSNTGTALALTEAAQSPEMPPLPSPPEAVRKLTGQSTNNIPSETAPSLTDSQLQGSSKNPGKTAVDDKGGAGKNGIEGQDSEEYKRNQQLLENFEDVILPKIERQLKELDENEDPNDITIDLRRQLRRAEDDIYRLLRDLRGSKSDAVQAQATGLQREFEDIREYVKRHGGTLVEE